MFGQTREDSTFSCAIDFGRQTSDFECERYAYLRIRIVRRRLHGVRREVHVEPSVVRQAADKLSSLQETRQESLFFIQFADEVEATFGDRREESRVHSPKEAGQGRIRATVTGKQTLQENPRRYSALNNS